MHGDDRSSPRPDGPSLSAARRRLVSFGRQGLGAISRRLVPAMVPILAWLGQKLCRIGANGIVVYRLGVPCRRDAGSCRLQRFSLKSRRRGGTNPTLGRFQSIRRSRGAIGRYQGPRGAVPMTTGLPRRRGRLRRRLPGTGKGLTVSLHT